MKTVESFPYAVRVIENTFISMRDGTRLAARIWLPESAEREPLPGILEYLPYRKRDFTRTRDAINHAYMAGHGYVCVRVDMRGSGDSDGVLHDEYTADEQQDAVQVIAWMARQDWCNGHVGMMGISWGGFNSLQVAAMRPAPLKAIISVCASDDLYEDNMHYMGGCLLGDNLSEATLMFAYNSLPPDPAIVGTRWRDMWLNRLQDNGPWIRQWLAHQRRDEYWTRSSVCENYAAVACPVYAIGGWADGYTNPVLRLLEHLEVPCKGLIGPWGHLYPHMGVPGPAIGFLQEALRWWDYWLKGQDNGIMKEPALRAWLQYSVPPFSSYRERPGRWISEPEWPSDNIPVTRHSLARHAIQLFADRKETAERRGRAEVSTQSPLSVGLSAGKWCSHAAAPDLPSDQREDDGGSVVFSSEPLDSPLEIVGKPVLELELAINKPQGMVAVRLSDVAPDGKATRVTYGLLNLSHRNSHAQPELMVPNERYRVTVALNGIAQQFPAGHMIRVSISTSYWPLAWPSPEPVLLTVFPEHCDLCIPVRTPQPDEDNLQPFAEPEGAEPLATEKTGRGEQNWVLHKDLAANESTLEVTNDHGSVRIEETGTVMARSTHEWYTFREDDFTSTRGETHTRWGLHRGDWNVAVETKTILTCSQTDFHVHAIMDAYEDDRRIYSRNWQTVIPRDHM